MINVCDASEYYESHYALWFVNISNCYKTEYYSFPTTYQIIEKVITIDTENVIPYLWYPSHYVDSEQQQWLEKEAAFLRNITTKTDYPYVEEHYLDDEGNKIIKYAGIWLDSNENEVTNPEGDANLTYVNSHYFDEVNDIKFWVMDSQFDSMHWHYGMSSVGGKYLNPEGIEMDLVVTRSLTNQYVFDANADGEINFWGNSTFNEYLDIDETGDEAINYIPTEWTSLLDTHEVITPLNDPESDRTRLGYIESNSIVNGAVNKTPTWESYTLVATMDESYKGVNVTLSSNTRGEIETKYIAFTYSGTNRHPALNSPEDIGIEVYLNTYYKISIDNVKLHKLKDNNEYELLRHLTFDTNNDLTTFLDRFVNE